MEWWSFFLILRKFVLSSVVALCVAWEIILSVYLAHQWKHFNTLQRVVVLTTIPVTAGTSVMAYLMMVYFRLWVDFVRVLCLFTVQSGIAVFFTIFGPRFSCTIFKSSNTCKDAYIVALGTTWGISSLLLFQALCLYIMSKVSRPVLDTESNPNFWPPEHTRRSSISSQTSSKGLLKLDLEKDAPRPSPSYPQMARVAPQGAIKDSSVRPPPAVVSLPAKSNYGTMNRRAFPFNPPGLPFGRFARTQNATAPGPAPSDTSFYSYQQQGAYQQGNRTQKQNNAYPSPAQSQRQAPPRPLLLNNLAGPHPPSRQGTADSTMHTVADSWMVGASQGTGASLATPTSTYSTASTVQSQLQHGPRRSLTTDTGSSHVYAHSTVPAPDGLVKLYGMPYKPAPDTQATPNSAHSFHSVAPSLHFEAQVPPQAHARTGGGSLVRANSYTTHGRAAPPDSQLAYYDTGSTGAADPRRRSSLPSGLYSQAAQAPVQMGVGRTAEQWRQLVMNAAGRQA
ncbi:hypothetical protein B0H21DRAFT_17547 [Amylocystis lapponica]|nr:hypothetical protein B0H21DRAFT_17547 [Amylocystis lapponica]